MAKAGTLDPILKAYLFATDRYIRMKNITNDDFKEKIMLFDRYVPSALAYRMAEGVDKNWVANINSIFQRLILDFLLISHQMNLLGEILIQNLILKRLLNT